MSFLSCMDCTSFGATKPEDRSAQTPAGGVRACADMPVCRLLSKPLGPGPTAAGPARLAPLTVLRASRFLGPSSRPMGMHGVGVKMMGCAGGELVRSNYLPCAECARGHMSGSRPFSLQLVMTIYVRPGGEEPGSREQRSALRHDQGGRPASPS
jgi:hypothetical protein